MKNLILFTILFSLSVFKTIAQKTDYNIIFLDGYFSKYAKLAQENNDDLKNLYQKEVQNRVFQKFFMQSEYSSFIYLDLARPHNDIPYLKKTIAAISTHKKEIEKTIFKTVKKCNAILPSTTLTIYIAPPSSKFKTVLPMMDGVYGFTAGSQQILISIDPNNEGWKEMLAYAVAHEYHHAYWTKENFAKLTEWTLLDYLVFEGKGDYFAKQLYPKVDTPWTKALTDEKKDELWSRVLPELQNQDFSFQTEVMFGSDNFPFWGGYTLGYDIVQGYLSKNETLSPLKWVNFSSNKVLKGSAF
ncbi:DUF2268 domain-containing protein [Aquimarina sp. AU474]|uniref:DUF2268 domain-containing protein n=1 Tax=Aquimarina sp. AU474 TaxID=2108529 RepID=UPI000D69E8AC|nr:DUF2268 domain-containing putative Zn-dependent protease [Aquimarina sp. AU474]